MFVKLSCFCHMKMRSIWSFAESLVLFFQRDSHFSKIFSSMETGAEKNKVDSQRVQGKNLFFFRFQSPFARTKSTLLPRTSIIKFSKASRDRNLYVTSLKKGQFFFSYWPRSTCSVIPGRKIVLQLLQESSMTIERQNCCFVEKQLHLSNKSLRVFR